VPFALWSRKQPQDDWTKGGDGATFAAPASRACLGRGTEPFGPGTMTENQQDRDVATWISRPSERLVRSDQRGVFDVSRLRQLMAERGANQAAVAGYCGFSQAHLSRILNGKGTVGPKAAARLIAWMQGDPDTLALPVLSKLNYKLAHASPAARVEALHLLAALERLLG
jgi:transcriptional regulator with XRE-family HTH domain